jgi:hypothetical protein
MPTRMCRGGYSAATETSGLREQDLGQAGLPAHVDLRCRGLLSTLLTRATKHERTLADRERVLGATHPNTLTSRNNLAAVYDDAGRLDEAIPLYERTLTDSERVLGDTHPQHPDHPQQSRPRLPGGRAAEGG